MKTETVPAPAQLLGPLKALADDKRLRILTLLASGERCVCELQDALGARQSLLSFHLRTLRDAGLVSDRRQGRWIYYSLERDALGELEELLHDLRTQEPSAAPPDRCC